VVIADDDTLIRDMLRLVLRDSEYEVVGEAANGFAALELCEKLEPDIILLDINMPGVDGLGVLDLIKHRPTRCQFIMISADATMEKVKRAMENGAAGFIVKPLRPGKVLDEINYSLRQAQKK
jgi:YesN/AraC family two-component response regulator